MMYNNYMGYGANMSPYQQQLAQNRLNQMEQQYNNMYQQQQLGTMQVIKGRPVSSYDEAKASMIDLDGSLFVFTDIANKRIYTKQIMLDGSAELKTYVLEERPVMKEEMIKQNSMYVLRSDFEKIVGEISNQISILKGELSYDATDDETDVKK